MNGLKRRLNALIVLCSALLGVAITVLVFWERTSFWFLVYALVPTGAILLVTSLYVAD